MTHLLLVPDDVLRPLPFGVLVTEATGESYARLADLVTQPRRLTATDLAAYAKLAWLANDYALTALPSATALRTLRQPPRLQGAHVNHCWALGIRSCRATAGGGGGPHASRPWGTGPARGAPPAAPPAGDPGGAAGRGHRPRRRPGPGPLPGRAGHQAHGAGAEQPPAAWARPRCWCLPPTRSSLGSSRA